MNLRTLSIIAFALLLASCARALKPLPDPTDSKLDTADQPTKGQVQVAVVATSMVAHGVMTPLYMMMPAFFFDISTWGPPSAWFLQPYIEPVRLPAGPGGTEK